MNKERCNQIIDEVFINYCQTKIEKTSTGEIWISYAGHYGNISKDDFINKCKTNVDFSQKWGLQIEERELSLDERKTIYENEYTESMDVQNNHWLNSKLTTRNIPTKLITLIYNNEKIEIYE